MSEFGLDDDDVVMVDLDKTLVGLPTFTVSQFREYLHRKLGGNQVIGWFTSGVPAKALKASGSGWRKGKVRLSLEFVPDPEEPNPEPTDAVLSPNPEQALLPPSSEQ